MGQKRSHSEVEGGEASGRPYFNNNGKRPGHKHFAKKQKVDATGGEKIYQIKQRARAIERLLGRENTKMPADKLNELRRELAAHKQRIAEAEAKKQRSKMIGKYHMVRFFERQKATRLVKQLKRKLGETEDPDEIAKLKADLHIAEVDVDYAKYFPFLEPYISLYTASGEDESKGKKTSAAEFLHIPRPSVWAAIEKAREEGEAALERIQNRQPVGYGGEGQPEASMGAAKTQSLRTKSEKGKHKKPKKADKGKSLQANKSRDGTGPPRNGGQFANGDDGDSDSDGGAFFDIDEK
ncbi:hypothetical protein OQA88_248 [Cercophora sp. LCS_1]